MSSYRTSHGRIDKVRAVRRIIEDGHCPHHVAADLAITAEQVHHWLRRYATPAEHAPGSLRLKTPADELRELRREHESLKRELETFDVAPREIRTDVMARRTAATAADAAGG